MIFDIFNKRKRLYKKLGISDAKVKELDDLLSWVKNSLPGNIINYTEKNKAAQFVLGIYEQKNWQENLQLLSQTLANEDRELLSKKISTITNSMIIYLQDLVQQVAKVLDPNTQVSEKMKVEIYQFTLNEIQSIKQLLNIYVTLNQIVDLK